MNIKRIMRSKNSKRFFIDAYSFIAIKLGFANTDLGVEISRYKIYNNLKKRYAQNLSKEKSVVKKEFKNRNVWVCWLQGFDNAPDLVKKCYESMVRNITEYNIVKISLDNINEYIEIPKYILEKWEKGIISNAHLSDIIRLELLVNYGGLWLDSTVWCTGDIPTHIKRNELFVYREGWYDSEAVNMGNWLISATPNNHILAETLKLLYIYWSENNYTYDYFIFHIFFKIVTENNKDKWDKVPVFYQNDPHILMNELNNKFNKERYDEICRITSFHKLTLKLSEREINKKDNFYNKILKFDLND